MAQSLSVMQCNDEKDGWEVGAGGGRRRGRRKHTVQTCTKTEN